MKKVCFQLEIDKAESVEDVKHALAHAIELLGQGFSSGDLRNESIGFGTFNLSAPEELDMDDDS